MKLNTNALTLEENYLFSEVAKRIRAFQAANPDTPVRKLSIGDVTRPLSPVITDAMKQALSAFDFVPAAPAVTGVPDVSAADNGKVLMVEDGAWAASDLVLEDAVGDAVSDWLDEHPEATTTVQDGSITEAKLSSDIQEALSNLVYIDAEGLFYVNT